MNKKEFDEHNKLVERWKRHELAVSNRDFENALGIVLSTELADKIINFQQRLLVEFEAIILELEEEKFED